MRKWVLSFCLVFSIFSYGQYDSALNNYTVDSGYFTSFDHTKIYYEKRGTGEPVVLIHGFIQNGESWKRLSILSELLKNGFEVITLDIRCNGRSDRKLNESAYAGDAEARDIIGLSRYLHLGKYDIIGYSRGSIIAARLLIKDRKVKKAVLGGMGTGFTNPQWPRRIMFYEALMGKPTKELEGAMKYVRQQGLDTLQLAYMQKYQPSTSPDELSKIKKQVLVICGDKDEDNGSAAALAKMIHSSVLVIVPGDHGSAPRSKEFSEAVVSFLK